MELVFTLVFNLELPDCALEVIYYMGMNHFNVTSFSIQQGMYSVLAVWLVGQQLHFQDM